MKKFNIGMIVWVLVAILALIIVVDFGRFQLMGDKSIVDRNRGFAINYKTTSEEADKDCQKRGGIQELCKPSHDGILSECNLGPKVCYANSIGMYWGYLIDGELFYRLGII